MAKSRKTSEYLAAVRKKELEIRQRAVDWMNVEAVGKEGKYTLFVKVGNEFKLPLDNVYIRVFSKGGVLFTPKEGLPTSQGSVEVEVEFEEAQKEIVVSTVNGRIAEELKLLGPKKKPPNIPKLRKQERQKGILFGLLTKITKVANAKKKRGAKK